MIKNPSNKLSSFLVIDEISSYIPAGVKKPFTKDLLQLLFKQARKYGVSCLIATQNPGDIDYKALSQFSTWSIGRLNTKQDFKKIESAINSVNSNFNFSTELPSLKTGEFLLYSPDAFDNCVLFKTYWLGLDMVYSGFSCSQHGNYHGLRTGDSDTKIDRIILLKFKLCLM